MRIEILFVAGDDVDLLELTEAEVISERCVAAGVGSRFVLQSAAYEL
jgi:hypothetical protein